MPTEPTSQKPSPATSPDKIHVVITREPFGDYFTLTLDNGHSEELEVEDTRAWFKERGAEMDKIEKVLDHCWNFYRSEVVIHKPKAPPLPTVPYAPKL